MIVMVSTTNRRAFTLVELLIVIAIIGLLVTLVIPSVRRAVLITRRTICLVNVNGIGKALATYESEQEHYLCCGKDEAPPKPCPENLLLSKGYCDQELFFCPDDKKNSYAETGNLFGSGGQWARTIFWPNGDDGTQKYVRYMHNYDLRDEEFSIRGMESSYIWEQGIVSDRVAPRPVESDSIILTEGDHVVNDWNWHSLVDESRSDQKHLNDTVNVLFRDGNTRTMSFSEAVNSSE